MLALLAIPRSIQITFPAPHPQIARTGTMGEKRKEVSGMRQNLTKRIRLAIGALGMAGWLVAGAAPAAAGPSFEFLFNPNRVSNDHQLFLNLAVSNSGYDRAVLEPVLPRIQNVEADL